MQLVYIKRGRAYSFGVRRLVGAIGTPRGLPARGPREKAVTSHRTPYFLDLALRVQMLRRVFGD